MICEDLPDKLKKICNGTANIPLSKINAYRKTWGLEELETGGNEEKYFIHDGKADIPLKKIKIKAKDIRKPDVKGCSSCTKNKKADKPKKIHKLGVGGELSVLFKSYGVPYCQACKDLAIVMDSDGPVKCRDNIEKIIDSILPRAREWVSKEYPWANSLFPDCIKDIEIKRRIKNLILQAIEIFERKEILRDTVFKPLKNGNILCSKQDVINECTVIVKSFKRFDYLIRFIESVFKYYPNLDIIVADDSLEDVGEYPEKIIEIMSHPLITWIKLPFDSGLSVGRNECVNLVTKKYTILCDDDYIVDEDANFEKMLSVLKSDERLSLVGGLMEENGQTRNWAGTYEVKNNVLHMKKLRSKKRVAGGVEYRYSDSVLNYFIAETESLRRVPWTPELKISSEHADFFLKRKNAGELSAYTPEARIKSIKTGSYDYEKYRRRATEFQSLMKEMHGLKEIITLNFQPEEFK